ncbi:MAG TPA: PQQ-dependent sugar dehydrogenase, partial [Acidimicrobiia bacterium]|nr:PQQ-dependent sugar dehydrogenase [Acidimicrobiia bacterium]
ARGLAVTLGVAISVAALAACQPTKKGGGGTPNLTVNVILGGLNNPWDIAFAPDAWYFTERSGGINAMVNGNRVLFGAPSDIRPGGEGGMMGIAVDPNYAANRFIYTCFSSNLGPDNRVVRWFVPADFSGIIRSADIAVMPYNVGSTGRHSGCRLKFGPDGFLWVGTGDAADCNNPQNLGSNGGKVLRMDGNGAPTPGNPFGSVIWSYGHRNVQGIAFRPGDGQPYSVEHGPDRDDEVNIEINGANYGWAPTCTYGEGVPMTFAGGQPAVWSSGVPTIAPSGATFLSGPQWKGWNGALAVAVLKAHHLHIYFLNAQGGIGGETIALPNAPRLRSATLGPDGNLYITTDVGGGGGQIWQVVPS